MTESAPALVPFVPKGRPVRRFVVALGALALMFAGLWWTALAAPRLGAENVDTTFDSETGRGTLTFTVENRGPSTVEIRGVAVANDVLKVTPLRPTGTGLDLGGGEEARLRADFECRKPAVGRGQPGLDRGPLRVTVRTAIGVERTLSVDVVRVPGPCLGPGAPRLSPPPRE